MVASIQDSQVPCRELFKALSDETRWLLVRELLRKPLTVGALAELLSVTHYNISKHLKVLRECGLVVMRREGRHAIACVNPAVAPRARTESGALVIELGCCEVRF
ncbi:MAG: metalloregulator ArsR/SmtB family transcription factor [Verrucomicrobiales bacterium]|nr:metalloregulator ArsR/SmtB family transcription factor [Verrucomicrobiales bacterium]